MAIKCVVRVCASVCDGINTTLAVCVLVGSHGGHGYLPGHSSNDKLSE